jgi:hypothetical protein
LPGAAGGAQAANITVATMIDHLNVTNRIIHLLVSYVLHEKIVLIWRGIPGIMMLHCASGGGQFWTSLLHRLVTSVLRLLPTLSGTSNSPVVPVRFRATA